MKKKATASSYIGTLIHVMFCFVLFCCLLFCCLLFCFKEL